MAISAWRHDMHSYVLNQAKMGWFNWERIDNYGASFPSRQANTMGLWTRTTIPWSLTCEDTFSHADAYSVISMQLETLGFVENFWFYGGVILVLLAIPLFAYLNMTTNERKDNMFLRLEPIGSRLIFLMIFARMSALSLEEREQCSDNIEAVESLNKTNPCMDAYSQVNTKALVASLESAQSTLDRYNVMYWLLFFLALGEFVALSFVTWRDWPRKI